MNEEQRSIRTLKGACNDQPKATRSINGIDEALYNRVVARVGHPKRGKIRINTALAAKLRTAGFSYKQVGEYMGVSGCTVKRRLREAGLI